MEYGFREIIPRKDMSSQESYYAARIFPCTFIEVLKFNTFRIKIFMRTFKKVWNFLFLYLSPTTFKTIYFLIQ